MRPIQGVEAKRGSMVDPALEKHLLSLQRAMSVDAFWKAAQQLLAAAVPNRLIGFMLQHNPILPPFVRWTLPMPDGFFAAEPLKSYIAAPRRKTILRIGDLFSNRGSFMKSRFYRRYMAPQECAHAVCLLFRENQRLVCAIVIMRAATQGDLSSAETKMGARATSQRSAQSLQARTRASSPVVGTTRHRSFETAQLSRPGAATFSDRVRGLAPSPCSACRGNGLPVAGSCPPDQTPTGNYTIGL